MSKESDMLLTVGLIAGGGYVLYNLSKGISDIGTGVGTAVTGTGEGISTAVQGVGSGLSTVGTSIGDTTKRLLRQGSDITGTVSTQASRVISGAGNIVTGTEVATYEIGKSILPYTVASATDLSRIGSTATTTIRRNVEDISRAEVNAVSKAANIIEGGTNLVYNGIVKIKNAITSTVKGLTPSTNIKNIPQVQSKITPQQLAQVQSSANMSMMTTAQLKQIQSKSKTLK